MLRIALKSALKRKGRLLLTSFAVVLGTAFLSGSFVFTDTIKNTFDDLFADVNADTDAFVRSSNVIEGDFGLETRNRIPTTLVDTISAVEGVAVADPQIQTSAIIIGREGKPITVSGPTFGGNVSDDAVSPWVYDQGRAPTNGDEVAIDLGSAKKEDFTLGEKIRVSAAGGTREFELVGFVKFGDVDSPGGASYVLLDLQTAQEYLLPQRDAAKSLVDAIVVKGDGSVTDEVLAERIQGAVDNETEVLTGAEITEENQSDIREGLNFFTIFLTVFALVALFVGSFVIANIFSITQAQRQRENALLRAIGAKSTQITFAALVEAALIGLVGSLLGLLGGIALAKGLQSMLAAFGIDIPAVGLTLLPRTIAITMIAGILVTIGAAILPSIKAGRIKPVEAMRESALETGSSNRSRLVIGLIALVVGFGAVLTGLFGGQLTLFGIGIPVTFIALYVLLPLFSQPITDLIGRPIEATRGITGRMARDNASRNPKRTARTAAALLIGVALVAGVSVIAASVKSSIRQIFAEQFTGDYAVSLDVAGGGPMMGGFGNDFADQLGAIDGVKAAAGISQNLGVVDGKNQILTVVNPATIGEVFDLKFTSGDAADLTADGVAISQDRATKDALGMGDTIEVQLVDGVTRTLTVQGIYTEDLLAGSYSVSRELFADTAIDVPDFAIFVLESDGANSAAVTKALAAAVEENGLGKLLPRDEYIDQQSEQINQIVNLVYGLLFLSVFIAIFGIILTLWLSVLERRRELALSRAVGMTKGQVWGMVSWEAVITSLLGTVVGILVGLVLGYALVYALRDEGFSSFTIPIATMITMFVISVFIGVVAAIIPAYRATKTDVVGALASS